MYAAKWAPPATKQYNKLKTDAQRAQAGRQKRGKTKSSRQEGLFKQVHKAIRLLLSNPRHPGLNSHIYDATTKQFAAKAKVHVSYAQNNTPGAYRIFWSYGPANRQITILAITPHP